MKRRNRFPSTDTFSKIQSKVNRIYDDLNTFKNMDIPKSDQLNFYIPKTDIRKYDTEYFLSIDLPGVDKNDIHISIEGNQLAISGKRRVKIDPEKQSYLKQERNQGGFQRFFTLPGLGDEQGIEASCENGVLNIKVPKAQKAKSRKIEIT